MGLFESIFGSKAKKNAAIALDSNELGKFVGGLVAGKNGVIEKDVFSRVSEIKHILNQINLQLEELKKKEVSLEDGNMRLRRAVRSSQAGLFAQFSGLVKKLEPPKTSDLVKIMGYAFSSTAVLAQGIVFARKNIVYTGTILDHEIRALGELVRELDHTFGSLKEIFVQSNLVKVSVLDEKLKELESVIAQKKSLHGERAEKILQEKAVRIEKERLEKLLGKLKSSPAALELDRLQQEKNNLFEQKRGLKAEFGLLFGEAEKPFNRLAMLAKSGKAVLQKDDLELLLLYLHNPFLAMKKDPDALALKKLVLEAQKLVLDSVISLKEKEVEKKLLALKNLAGSDFADTFSKVLGIEEQLGVVDRKIESFSLGKEIFALEQQVSIAERAQLQQNDFIKNFSSKEESVEKKMLTIKASIEKEILEQFGKQVVVQL